MSKPRLNLVGQKFGRLTVLSRVEPLGHRTKFVCLCDCGKTTVTIGSDILSGNTTSCGCMRKIIGHEVNVKHGASIGMTGAYRSWRSMKQRCLDKNCKSWPQYGGVGVTICDRWLESFDNFLADMGERPDGYSLERIDVFKGYEPSNCKWISLPEQLKNKRNTVRYKVGDQIMIQSDLARHLKIHPSSLYEMRRDGRLPTHIQSITA
jgi:hypothetical protein